MTDNLASKFETLTNVLIEHNTAILAAINSLGPKLDAIATAVGAPPPEGLITLEDILSILTDIHLDTVSMDQKLLKLRDGLVLDDPTSGFTVQSRMNLLLARFEQSIGLIGQHSPYPVLQLLLETGETLQLVREAIGIPTGDATTTALGLLLSIRNCGCSGLPSAPDTDLCAEPFVSIGTERISEYLSVPGGGGNGVGILYNAAVWSDDPPAGLTVTGGVDIGASDVIITADNWADWRVWVESEEATYSDVFPPVAWYPTGEWRQLTGAGPKVFTSAFGGTLQVHLGPVDGNGGGQWEGGCVEVSSQLIECEPAFGYSPRRMAIPTLLPLRASITWTPSGALTTTPAAIVDLGLAGYNVESLGGRVRIVYGVNGAGINSHVLAGAGESYTIPSGGDYVLFDDATGIENEPGTGPFSIRVCEPSPG